MRTIFKSATEVAQAIRDTDLVDDVVSDMAGNDKNLRVRLMEVVETHFIADARHWPEDRVRAFAQELFDVANPVAEPA
jgi:hypothetical protein